MGFALGAFWGMVVGGTAVWIILDTFWRMRLTKREDELTKAFQDRLRKEKQKGARKNLRTWARRHGLN